jgi:serine carboxypeptidase-like clade 2
MSILISLVAGHYIPQLAALLMEYNKNPNIKPIKLRAIAVMT